MQHVAHRHSDEIHKLHAEIERLRTSIKEAREWLSEAVNTLADPHAACDFEGSEIKALLQTLNDGLSHLRHVAKALGSNEQ